MKICRGEMQIFFLEILKQGSCICPVQKGAIPQTGAGGRLLSMVYFEEGDEIRGTDCKVP